MLIFRQQLLLSNESVLQLAEDRKEKVGFVPKHQTTHGAMLRLARKGRRKRMQSNSTLHEGRWP